MDHSRFLVRFRSTGTERTTCALVVWVFAKLGVNYVLHAFIKPRAACTWHGCWCQQGTGMACHTPPSELTRFPDKIHLVLMRFIFDESIRRSWLCITFCLLIYSYSCSCSDLPGPSPQRKSLFTHARYITAKSYLVRSMHAEDDTNQQYGAFCELSSRGGWLTCSILLE